MGVVAAAGGGGVSNELAGLLAGRDTRWYKGYHLKLNIMLLLILITSMTNGYDGSMMNGLQALDTWKEYFNHPERSPTLFGVFNAIQSIGGIVGLPFAPYLADYFGRRWTIFLGAALMVIATVIQTASQNVGMFIFSRGLIGFGLSWAGLASPLLITELAFPTHRAPITSLYNSMWYLGSIVAAWTTFGTFRIANTWSWRIPSVLQGVPSVLQILFIFFIPESPRWLISKGKVEPARDIITKVHCGGDVDDPLVDYEVAEIREMLRIEQEAAQSSSWKELFTTPGNLRRMRIIMAIAFFSQWSGNGLVSYYLTIVLKGIGITSPGHQTLINGVLQVYNFFWAIVGALTVDRVGRRFLFMTSTIGMMFSFVAWTICSALYRQSATEFEPACLAANNGNSRECVALNADKSAGNGVIAFIFIFYAFYDIAMSPLLVSYTVEILPFRVRAKGLMAMQMCVNASLVFNQYVNPIAMDALDWKYYIVFCVFLAFTVVYCYLFVIETRGPDGPLSLEEIAALFDGPHRYGFQKNPVIDRTSDVEAEDLHGKGGLNQVPFGAVRHLTADQ
ncbi:uncharacterized protein CcaverHIS019_0703360 [Cutaneotrichosporon cavernicola]|uniref:Major facilitator superfamily (MFS) profile domain-containing protein n=1 Tax=Cutaneotrichosporon cavernicola TaxID=279322 RepID=A0AA48QYY3_9TREE|nr:uncharacterized protein CcaverHIS019_0703360 [Cutaneotrichosporon cavernicola]BEI94755.1 hypothetical protein CcaverHIS019_0703360 [Cutaneotrichosporon cavernicola]BEJ02530.1 hypothetical protein CcaverHIS631_0703250 [Cutaneotrichosporon cavernicola]